MGRALEPLAKPSSTTPLSLGRHSSSLGVSSSETEQLFASSASVTLVGQEQRSSGPNETWPNAGHAQPEANQRSLGIRSTASLVQHHADRLALFTAVGSAPPCSRDALWFCPELPGAAWCRVCRRHVERVQDGGERRGWREPVVSPQPPRHQGQRGEEPHCFGHVS